MPGMIMVYGIPNCDSVKKARTWLALQQLDYQFHDFKKQGVPAARLTQWEEALGWATLLNRRGTSWRKLDAATQATVCDAASAQTLMLSQPSLIKRPVVEWGGRITVGFDPQSWSAASAGAGANLE